MTNNQQKKTFSIGKDGFEKQALLKILLFFLPLALTHIMMAGGTPIVNAGIARRPDPVEGLAAFAVAFSVSVFLNSLIFGIEPAAIALIKGAKSGIRVTRFSIALGMLLGVIELIIGLSPLATIVFEGMFGLPEPVAEMAAWTLCAFSPIPVLLAIRSIGRGICTAIDRTTLVGWGTLLRLGAMVIVVFAGAFGLPVPGPILGAIAFGLGIAAETVFVAVGALRNIDRLPGDSDTDAGSTYGGMIRFIYPVLVSGLFVVGLFPLINTVLSRTPDGEVAVSSFSVIRSVAWFIASMLIAFQQLVIARSDPEEQPYVLRFAILAVAAVTLLLSIVAYSPVGIIILRDIIGIKDAILASSLQALNWVPLIPPILGIRCYMRGLAIRDGNPGHVLSASIFGLAFAVLSGIALMDVISVGAVVAVAMWCVANIAETVFLGTMRWRIKRFADEN